MAIATTQSAEQDLRELTTNEIESVSGGFFPLLVLAFAVGFDIGFITTMALAPTGLEG